MRTEPKPRLSGRKWASGLAVTLTTIIAYMAFWRLAPVITFAIGCLSLIALVVAGWIMGREDAANECEGREP